MTPRRPYSRPAVQTASRCLVDGCDRPEELINGRSAGGLCAGHRKRKVRGQVLEGPLDERLQKRLSPTELLLIAVVRLANADEQVEYRRARRNFFKRVWKFVRSRPHEESHRVTLPPIDEPL